LPDKPDGHLSMRRAVHLSAARHNRPRPSPGSEEDGHAAKRADAIGKPRRIVSIMAVADTC
jgi:hypothetical protein